MDCDGLRGVLLDHVDGLLGRDEAEAARAHLVSCAGCRRLQEEVRRNFAALDAWEDEEPPAGSFDRLVARLPGGPRATVRASPGSGLPPRRSWARVLVPYAAGLASAAGLAALLLHPWGEGAPSAPPASGTGIGLPAVSVSGAIPAVRPDRAPRPGEPPRPIEDYRHNVIRRLRLPADVDPADVELVSDEGPVVPARGGVR